MACLAGRHLETLHEDLIKMKNVDELYVFLFIIFYPISFPLWTISTAVIRAVGLK
jgi:hypothetical protein